MLSKEASSTIFLIFCMTQPEIEPRALGPLGNIDMLMNSLLPILFSNKPDLFLYTVKWFLVLLSCTNSFICTQLNEFKYCYLALIVLFAHSKMVSSIAS